MRYDLFSPLQTLLNSLRGAKPPPHKPEISYAIIERLYPEARRPELFARYLRPGWDCRRNEIPADIEVAMP